MSKYEPPFKMNSRIASLLAEIGEEIGKIDVHEEGIVSPSLRRENRIRSIHSSLAIEHNSLSLEEVTAIIDGKRVIGDPREIKEVENANEGYAALLRLDPSSVADLLEAHGLMMNGLIKEAGQFRSSAVGVFAGDRLIHMAPPAKLVPQHIDNLFAWYAESDMHPLIKSAIFHSEFEFIHPFADGNGRTGRLWHTLLLGHWRPHFYYLPIEEMIKKRQMEYYKALAASESLGDTSRFVQLMLEVIKETLQEISADDPVSDPVSDQVSDQVEDFDRKNYVRKLLVVLGNETLSAKELMERMGLSHKTFFRRNYLYPALEDGFIERTIPEKPNSSKQKYRKKPPSK